jgi:hypothetical protein
MLLAMQDANNDRSRQYRTDLRSRGKEARLAKPVQTRRIL